MEVNGQLHTQAALSLESLRRPLKRRLGGGDRANLEAVERGKNFLPVPGIEPPLLGHPPHLRTARGRLWASGGTTLHILTLARWE
jgi:hypothetical protein